MERKYLGMSLNELNETPLEEAQRKWGEVTERVRSSSAAWQAMLATAARNHKYSFRDQLMIHEYRPHATACAEHDFWEQRFHRRVHKGLKGIRLLSEDGRDVRNVFDVGDTWPYYGHEHDLPPYIWRVSEGNTAAVSQRFREAFEVDGTLPEQVQVISKRLAEMARPMYNIGAEHSEDLLLSSITFYIATRLGLDTGDMNLSFEGIRDLNHENMLKLGSLVNRAARVVLDQAEQAVRLHRERGAANVHRDDKGTANARAVEGLGRSEDVDHQLLQQRGLGTRVPGDSSEGEGDARRGLDDLSRGGPDGAGEGGPAGGRPDAGEGERAALHEGAGHLGAVQGADTPHPGEGFGQVRPDAPEVPGGVEGPEGVGAGRGDSGPLPGGSGPGEGDEAGDHGPVAGTEPVGRDDGVGAEGRDGGLGSGAVRPRHGDLAGGEQGQLTLDFGLGEPERSTAPQALEPEPELEAPKVPEENHFDAVFGKVYLNLTGVATHNVELGESATGNLTRIENAIEGIPARLQEAQEKLENLHGQVRAAKEELGRDFPHAQELREKTARLSELNTVLSMRDNMGEHNVSEHVEDFGKLDDRERIKFLVKEAERHPEQAPEILNAAFRQGVYVTSQLQASNCGFYNIFKLRDVMSDAGLSDSKRFDSLLCKLRDEEQVQLHAGDVTVHTSEENEKGFIDENGFRMGTFTLSRAPEAFRATEESLMRVLPRPRNTCGQELKHEITEGDIVALKLSENPKVHLKPYTKGSFFDGEIAHVDKERGYCVQRAGNSLTVHRLEALETVPEVGEKVRITYPKDEGRKAGVAVREQRQRCHRIA